MLARRRQAGRRRDPGLLLRAEARRAGRRLPHVPGRDRGDPETADLLLDPGPRRHGRPHPHRAGQARAERGGRVPARQPPARLPRLRQRRRVPAAGHHDGLGPGQEPHDRPKAPLREADRALAAGRDRPRALHPLLPLRALQPGGLRGRAAAAAGARRPHLRRHLRRPPLRRPLPRQHHRPLPGRGADQLHLPLPRPALGHRAGGLGLHALPEPVQRQLHRPRRAGEAGDRPRQPRGRRRLALRPRPLRLRDVRRRGAGRAGRACAAAPSRAGRRRSRKAAEGLRAAGARGRRDRRRRLQRGGLPGPAHPPRGARLAARRLAPLARARRASRWSGSPSPSSRRQGPRHRRRRRDPRRSAPTRCTARRSSTCASARRSAATAPSWRSRPSARPRSTAAPRRSPATPPASAAALPRRAGRPRSRGADERRRTPRRRRPPRGAEKRRRHLGRAHRPRGRRRRSTPCSTLAAALDLAGNDGSGLLEIPDAHQRPRPARGRLPPRRRPGPQRPSDSARRQSSSRKRPRRSAPRSSRAS